MAPSPSDQHLTRFLHELVVGLINLEMHGEKSQEVTDSVATLMRELSHVIHPDRREHVEIGIVGACIHVDGRPFVTASLQARSLITRCADRNIDAVKIYSRIEPREMKALIRLLGDPANRGGFRDGHASSILAEAGILHAEVISGLVKGAQGLPLALERYQDLADCLQESHIAAFQGHDIDIEQACGAIDAALSEADAPAGMLALASHDFIDSFTVGHSVRVALLALQVASAGGASRQDLVRVGTAGLLHDIGKSRIPQEVLFKKGALTEEERQIMSQHPRLGGEVLLEQAQLDPAAIGAAFCHHMKPDGGYPSVALPFEPSGISKLVQVCDVFEALTAVRPYKRAMTPLEAYAVMFRNEHDFDPRWLKFFVQALGVYPQGTFLALDTGEVGVVTQQGRCPNQPIVKILTTASGQLLPEQESSSCVLGAEHDGVTRNAQEVAPGNPIVCPLLTADDTVADPEHHDPSVISCCGEDLVGR